jgi:glycosyltransferase involved in cell wall biosynthesis
VTADRLLLVLGSSAGGVARHVAQVARVLGEAGWRVRAAGPQSVRELVSPAELTVVDIADRPHAGRDLRAVRALRQLAHGADVVHAHGLRAGALSVLAARGLRRAPAPGRAGAVAAPRVVVTLHNLPVGGRGVRAVSTLLERVVARGADVVLGVSPDLVARSEALGARRTGLALVPPPEAGRGRVAAVAAAETRTALGIRTGERLFVTVGRLAPQKGVDRLVDVAARLVTEGGGGVGSSWRWVVAGDGPLRAGLEARIAAGSLPVDLLGSRDDVPALLAAADLVVSAAEWEGQPLWLQEALVQRAAIVATDVGGTSSVLGDAAVLVPPGDARALADAISRLVRDDEARRTLQDRAGARAAAIASPRDVGLQLEEIYRAGSA